MKESILEYIRKEYEYARMFLLHLFLRLLFDFAIRSGIEAPPAMNRTIFIMINPTQMVPKPADNIHRDN